MDSLRATAMTLGIFFHAALSFVPTAQYWWIIEDQNTDKLYYYIFFLLHAFRMPLFFLIAGFFGRLLYYRLGLIPFIRHRTVRIIIPLMTGLLILVPLIHSLYIYKIFYVGSQDLFPAFFLATAGYLFSAEYTANFAPAHLWFLYYLIMLYVILITLTRVLSYIRKSGFHSLIDNVTTRLLGSFWKPVVLSVPTVLIFYFMPKWYIETPDKGFIPDIDVLIFYGIFFTFGWVLHRQSNLLEQLKKYAWPYTIIAMVIFLPVSIYLQGFKTQPAGEYYRLIELCALLSLSLLIWLVIFGLMGMFGRYLNGGNFYIRYISDSSYWLYLIHLPIVMYLQVVLAESNIAAFWKFMIISLITIIVCLITYRYIVRYTFIGKILNGFRPTPDKLYHL